ncbi:carbamoyl-phosphate synthase small subunit [Chromobacterium sp. Panama]|uniref:ATP-grasp domain-containing protein n=1 Tax=Chromobacterium sp. Panama TaxID=2161826 RepID=UPI000D2F571E|nr:ATP-grasp domain-containing protein [Chromobacterium sp. Panama]PTU67281.1 carbamoyl-phosphate synthase small subunit [Chromobacterium sp. Panama]
MKPWVLLVGTSFSAAPLLFALRRRGFRVAVCGAQSSDPCVAYADAYHPLDYSDRETLLHLIQQQGYRYVCPSCNDYAYLSASYAAHRLGLPGYDTPAATAIIHNKARFRAHAEAIGLSSPRARAADDPAAVRQLRLPLLVKPTDSFSGRGMQRVEQYAELAAALDQAKLESRDGEAVVEEFINGSLHSHSAFLAGGEIAHDAFVDEFCQTYPYQVDCSNSPSRLSETVKTRVRDEVLRLAASLCLADGLIHTQFINGPDRPYLIESMRRCPGDLFYHLVEFSTGGRYLDSYVAPFIGQALPSYTPAPLSYWARHTVSFATETVFFSLSPKLPQALDIRVFPLAESASAVRPAPYGKAAIVFARLSDQEALFDIAPRLASFFPAHTLERDHE